jgi:hypothetical protein
LFIQTLRMMFRRPLDSAHRHVNPIMFLAQYGFQTAKDGSLRPGFAGTLNDSQTAVSEGLRR